MTELACGSDLAGRALKQAFAHAERAVSDLQEARLGRGGFAERASAEALMALYFQREADRMETA